MTTKGYGNTADVRGRILGRGISKGSQIINQTKFSLRDFSASKGTWSASDRTENRRAGLLSPPMCKCSISGINLQILRHIFCVRSGQSTHCPRSPITPRHEAPKVDRQGRPGKFLYRPCFVSSKLPAGYCPERELPLHWLTHSMQQSLPQA